MELRDARPEDGPGIGLVHAESWRSAYRGLVPDTHLERLEPAALARTWRTRIETRALGRLWVAVEGDEVRGFVTAHRSSRPTFRGSMAEIGWLYVHPDHTRHGIGSALLTSTMRTLEAAGMRWVTLDVLEANVLAQRFYERHRFQRGDGRWIDPRFGAPVVRYEQPLNRVFDFRSLATERAR